MFGFIKKMFCSCKSKTLEQRQDAAHRQDKEVRESLSEKQIDKGVNDTMIASDPVAKY